MKFNSLALAGAAAAVVAAEDAPAGCSTSYDGSFKITAYKVAKRELQKRKDLVLTLNDGTLKDDMDRIGYIASNYQFQFDNPVQPDAISSGPFSVCNNGSLANGGSTTFYQCLSGDFYNLYDRHWAEQCEPIQLITMPTGTNGGSGGDVTQIGDGQPQESDAAPVSELPDGQPNAPTGAPVTELPDGQPNAPTGAPVTELPDGQPNAPTGAPVTELPDGQPNAPTGAPVTELPDGQPNAPTGSPVTEKTDGQPNAPTGAPVTEKTDGQPNAPTGASNSTLATVPKPSGTSAAVSTIPTAAGNKAFVSSAALFVAGLGAVFYL